MATVLPKLLRDFRARELSKFLPSAAQAGTATSTPATTPTSTSAKANVRLSNPFQPWYNPKTGRWAPPLYSRRRQKELVKAARSVALEFEETSAVKSVGAIGLLPPGPKCNLKEVEKGKQVWKEVVKDAAWLNTSPSDSENAAEASTSSSSSGSQLSDDVDVEWVGRLRPSDDGARASVVSRLYANKKRMFKGHKWERALESRKRMIRVRMRDMEERVQRFKNHYRRRRPNPLRPPVTRKKESLPF